MPDTADPDEAAYVRALERMIDEADVFVDAGANMGFYTCLARARGRQVVAIEPFPLNVTSLARNLAANGWTDVDVRELALAEHEGRGTLYGRDTLASRVTGWAVADDQWRHAIALATLDALLDGRFAGARLAIKIDVEGGEYDLLRGAARTLDRAPAPVWSVEITLTEHHPSGRHPHFAETFDLFFSRGYGASTISSAGETAVSRDDVTRWADAGRRGFGTVNYFFRRIP